MLHSLLHSLGHGMLTQIGLGGWPSYSWQLAELNWRLDTGPSAQNFRIVWAVSTDLNLEPGSRLLQHILRWYDWLAYKLFLRKLKSSAPTSGGKE